MDEGSYSPLTKQGQRIIEEQGGENKVIKRTTKQVQDRLDHWKREHEKLVRYQSEYAMDPTKITPEKMVLFQLQYIEELHADFDEMAKEYINMLLETPPKQDVKLEDLCDQAEDYIKERYPEDERGSETSSAN